jgi:alpha-ketoglutaric semialdehyde dehydrogenase
MTEPATAPLLIGGEWMDSAVAERTNPARPSEVVVRAAQAGSEHVEEALTAASGAQPDWARTAPAARGAILARASELLRARAREVAAGLTAEEGKTLAEATGEVNRAADILRFFGGEGWRLGGEALPGADGATQLLTRKEPLGVVAVITPWNFPIAIPTWKIAPALVSGNAVVFKPASLTPLSAHRLVECLMEAGLPPGVISVLHGSGSTVGDALVRDDRVAAVSFTGSTSVGMGIHRLASDRLARVQLEMGGKNALVVLDDADPARAAQIAAAGAFGLTGQACTATSRVICTPGAIGPVTEALTGEAQRWLAGDGAEDGTRMGPVVSEAQLRTNASYLELAREEGGELLSGGARSDQFFDPVVVAGLHPAARVAREEIFGPVVSVFEAHDLEAAIELTNDSDYGLTAGIVTNDMSSVMRFIDNANVGVVKVNRATTGLDLNVPFGGVKSSSTGTYREQGSGAVDFYTRIKTIYLGA